MHEGIRYRDNSLKKDNNFKTAALFYKVIHMFIVQDSTMTSDPLVNMLSNLDIFGNGSLTAQQYKGKR